MGLNAGGRDPRLVDPAAMAEMMRPVVTQWFAARIVIEDPELDHVTEYDPLTDTGGTTEPTIVHEGLALIQPLPNAATTVFGDQQLSVGAVRIQIDVPSTVELRSGLRIRVTEAANDHILALRPMSLDDVATGSLAWTKILMARVLGS
jgi:hypothetical protein